MPEGAGRGVVGFDREAPRGVETFAAPRWQPGDRMVYLRGNALRPTMHVEARDGGYALVDVSTGAQQIMSAELADLGLAEPNPDGSLTSTIELAPADQRYHWPLWVGKRWTCHLLRKVPGHPPLPLIATYVVEGSEEVTVPAGTFRALRILRRSNVAAEGTYVERAALTWYAPAAGVEVRRLEDGVLTELAELHRQ
jgi:hypothetical protein